MYDNYKYVVTPTKVIALSTYAGKVVRGIAKCSPQDKFDEEYGKMLAAARCNLKVAEKRLKRADKVYTAASKAMRLAERDCDFAVDYWERSNQELNDAMDHLERLLEVSAR